MLAKVVKADQPSKPKLADDKPKSEGQAKKVPAEQLQSEEEEEDEEEEGEEEEEDEEEEEEEEEVTDDSCAEDKPKSNVVPKKSGNVEKSQLMKEVSGKSATEVSVTKQKDTTEVAASKTIVVQKEDTKEEVVSAAAVTTSQGESLLLPLLQGLLHKNTPQQQEHLLQQQQRFPSNKRDPNITLLHIEDSGTESGEDLKLLAAGLHDHIEMEREKSSQQQKVDQGQPKTPVQNDLVTDVTVALNRLQSSLLNGHDVDLDLSKRNALLSLVSRLQTGLLSPEKISPTQTTAATSGSGGSVELSSPETESISADRRPSAAGRFANRRRNRQNRHTVGVSQEELADARRYIEELVLIENLSNCGTPPSTPPTPHQLPYSLQKQSSAGALLTKQQAATVPSLLFRPNQFVAAAAAHQPQIPPSGLVTDSNKPFVQMRDRPKPKYKFMRQSLSYEQDASEMENNYRPRPFSESISIGKLPPHGQVDELKSTKYVQNAIKNDQRKGDYSSDEEIGAGDKKNNPATTSVVQQRVLNGRNCRSRTPPGVRSANVEHPSGSNSESDKSTNKFNSKKLKMKRANTIDIPKANQYARQFQNEDDTDESDYRNSIGLKRAILVSEPKVQPRKVIPAFQPKTENDHKFLAFIQKQNPTNGLGWVNPNKSPQPTNSSNWSNAFGNIKNTFENTAAANSLSRKPPPSVARNFWKNAETPTGKPCSTNSLFNGSRFSSSLNGINKVTNTPTMHTPTQQIKMVEQPQMQNDDFDDPSAIVNGSIRIGAAATDQNAGKSIIVVEEPQNIVLAPKPIRRNDFSHAPASAFRPIVRKMEIPAFKPIQQVAAVPHKPSIPSAAILATKMVDPTRPAQVPANSVVRPVPSLAHGVITAKPSTQTISNNVSGGGYQPKIQQATSPTNRNIANVFQNCAQQSQIKSPTIGTPWANKITPDKRVLTIAASKFDVKPPPPASQTARTNSMRTAPRNLPSAYNGGADQSRLTKKRGSLPNESTYNYFSESEIPYKAQTQSNTYENENYYNYRPEPQKLLQSAQYFAPSMPNLLRQEQYRKPQQPAPNVMYQQQHHQPTNYSNYSNNASAQQPQRPLQYPLPPPPTYQPLPQQKYYQQQEQPNRSYQPPPPQYSAPVDQFPCYSYTCTDYTQPTCVSTYMPRLTVTESAAAADSITNPAAEPLVLCSTRPIISPQTKSTEHLKVYDYPSSSDTSQMSTSVSPMTINDPMELEMDPDDDDDDVGGNHGSDGMHEYTAKTQVMRGPVSQTAVTVAHKTSHVGDDDANGKDSQAARNLQSILKGIKSTKGTINNQQQAGPVDIINKYKQDIRNISNKSYDQTSELNKVKVPQMAPPKIVETPSSPMIGIGPSDMHNHIVFNNVSYGDHSSNNQRRQYHHPSQALPYNGASHHVPNGHYQMPMSTSNNVAMFHQNEAYQHPPSRSPIALSKSDSWTQICKSSNKPPSPHTFAEGRPLQKTKSGHTLALPKPFEAGIRKTEVSEKQRTVAAYFSGEKSPLSLSRSSSQQNVNEPAPSSSSSSSRTTIANIHYGPTYSSAASSSTSTLKKKTTQINRIKSSEKASTSKQFPSSGLARSHTMPHIVDLNLLDESNVEDAFEDLFNESMS